MKWGWILWDLLLQGGGDFNGNVTSLFTESELA